ncbi:MAG: hypothetical protein MI749_11790, partial [Desulfovibrionales bacterium]|nr:hypothetical protein [Desulfovibrionales bacterium]
MGNRSIGRAWEKMAQSDFPSLMAQLGQTKRELHLNDWGYFMLLHGLADEILPHGGNEKHVLVWFLMNKSGYDTKIGYRNERPLLLVAVSERVFGVPFLSQNGKRYYLLSPKGPSQRVGNVYTYKKNYPGADHPMSFRMSDYPGLKTLLDARILKFKFQGKPHSVKVLFNKKSIPYFQYYPQTQADIYASAAVPGWLGTTLLEALKPLLKDLSDQEAANLLLCFVQTSFDYKTDQQQFGREKYLFPEETIFYPYSDCEDRSILFSYLVKQLLGLDVVLLSYSDHMATAVRFKQAVAGDRVQWGNGVYTVCDPTYINAPIGMAMPKYKGSAPEVLKIF